ncbi:MAG: hypothetical protein Q9175_001256 [Cornicularia normoerica]
MSSLFLIHLPLGNTPKIVSNDPPLLTAWESINVWFQKVVDSKGEKKTLVASACFIMMACKCMNARITKMVKEGTAARLAGGLIIKKMQEVSSELKRLPAVTDWMGEDSSLQAFVGVGTLLYNALYQQKSQYGASQPLAKATLLPVQRVWNLISLAIEISPEPGVVKSKDVKGKLAWLQRQLDESSKRRHSQDDAEDEEKSKKARTATSDVMKRIEVIDPYELDTIKRYDNDIGVVPIHGPVKNRSVVTAYDVSSLSQGTWVNDAAIDAHLTLVCHTFNDLFHEGVELPKSPRYHAWSVEMSIYLQSRVDSFEERHLRQEWPPARFLGAALEDVSCHIFPIHVRETHWILMVLQKMEDGQWTLFRYSSLPGYDKDFEEPWRFISSWLLYKTKSVLNVTRPRVLVPNPQPTQDNTRDCGVFVCGIVRWSLEGWDLTTLTPSMIPEYRRRMMLELEKWNLSTNSL